MWLYKIYHINDHKGAAETWRKGTNNKRYIDAIRTSTGQYRVSLLRVMFRSQGLRQPVPE